MTSCVEMKVGQVYVCPDCGVELQVVKACGDDEHQAAVLNSASSCAATRRCS